MDSMTVNVLAHRPTPGSNVTELRELAHGIAAFGPTGMDAFAGLVDDSDPDVSLLAAHHLVTS
jgi:hypothetical protein